MDGRNRSIGLVAAAVMFAAAMLPEVAAEVRYMVGDDGGRGWGPRSENLTNYTVWAQDKHFYKGDWLYFVYNRYQNNVLEVNQSGYNNCISDTFLHNWTTGAGRDVVQLKEMRPYYFISGNGYCFSGMKLAVHVESRPPPPSSSPKKSEGSRLCTMPTFRAQVVLPALFAVGAVWDSLLMIL